jgi:N-acetyl-alpha-D-glucosaminyl L-malate synthase BshA
MKILLISIWKPRRGGIATHVESLIKRSREIFTILTYRDKSSVKEKNVIRVPYLDFPFLRGMSFASLAFLRGLIAKFDIIHAHYAIPQGFAGVLIKKVRKKPMVLTVHGSDLTILGGSPLIRPLLKWILNRTDRIIAVSNYLKTLLLELDVPEEKISVIYNGVDQQDPAGGGEKRIIYIGALVHQKGVDVLLNGFKKIKETHPDLKLVIVGDGPERENLEGLAEKLGLTIIEFTGYLEDLDQVFTSQSILVLPSRKEGFGIALLEAMARGVPVVASKTGGVLEIVEDGRNGLLFSKEHPESLADAVIKLLDNSKLRTRIVKGGLKTAEKFSWDKMAEETDVVYDELAGKSIRT